jgi:hypothetical protein
MGARDDLVDVLAEAIVAGAGRTVDEVAEAAVEAAVAAGWAPPGTTTPAAVPSPPHGPCGAEQAVARVRAVLDDPKHSLPMYYRHRLADALDGPVGGSVDTAC